MADHIIIYSHGFGVRKDDRGLFTDIASTLPRSENRMFDYNAVDETNNTLTVAPLAQQAARLQEEVARALRDNPEAKIDLICHSQGCVVAGMAELVGVRKTIMLAPPTEAGTERMMESMSRLGAQFNLVGTSRINRADGSITLVPAAYWMNFDAIDPVALYNACANHTELHVIGAKEDEILGEVDYSALSPSIHIETMPAGHNFEGVARMTLFRHIEDILFD